MKGKVLAHIIEIQPSLNTSLKLTPLDQIVFFQKKKKIKEKVLFHKPALTPPLKKNIYEQFLNVAFLLNTTLSKKVLQINLWIQKQCSM